MTMPPGDVLEEQTMAIVKVVITKRTTFQNRGEEFSNAYTYDAATLDEEHLNAIADAVVNAEKLIHGSAVDFIKAQVYDVGVPPNYMRISKTLTGSGSAASALDMYRECVVMLSWPLPRRFGVLRTIRRDLRKYLHTVYKPPGMTPDGNGAASPVAVGSPLDLYRNIVEEPVGGVELCAENGDRPTGPMVVHPYLEHRQFPRGRKES